MSDDEIVTGLQDVLADEMRASRRYLSSYVYAKAHLLEKFAQKMWQEFEEETQHAILVADRILFLGGTPNVTAPDTENGFLNGVMEIIEDAMKMEVSAIEKQGNLITSALKIGDYGTERIVKSMLPRRRKAFRLVAPPEASG